MAGGKKDDNAAGFVLMLVCYSLGDLCGGQGADKS